MDLKDSSEKYPSPKKKTLFDTLVHIFAIIGLVSTIIYFLFLGGIIYMFAADTFGIQSFMLEILSVEFENPDANPSALINNYATQPSDNGSSPSEGAETDDTQQVGRDTLSLEEESTRQDSSTQSLIETFGISDTQLRLLQIAGIDPETLPTQMTPALEECLRREIGNDTYDAIVAGTESPGPGEVIKAKTCL